MEITIKPAQNRAVADEQGTFITDTTKGGNERILGASANGWRCC